MIRFTHSRAYVELERVRVPFTHVSMHVQYAVHASPYDPRVKTPRIRNEPLLHIRRGSDKAALC